MGIFPLHIHSLQSISDWMNTALVKPTPGHTQDHAPSNRTRKARSSKCKDKSELTVNKGNVFIVV